MNDEEIAADWCEGFEAGSVKLTEVNEQAAAKGTQEAIDAAKAKLTDDSLKVFDTATFTVNEVTYSVKKDADGNVVATASDGSEVTVTVWDEIASKLSSFATTEGEAEPIAWTISEFGGVNKNGTYYSS